MQKTSLTGLALPAHLHARKYYFILSVFCHRATKAGEELCQRGPYNDIMSTVFRRCLPVSSVYSRYSRRRTRNVGAILIPLEGFLSSSYVFLLLLFCSACR